jgi:agmatinase
VRPIVLGGDHSCAWPVASALSRAYAGEPWGIVQIDAHTDLLSDRLGVKYCFATWSYHANELVGRNGRLTQVGIRATRFPREHWEDTLGVRQFWAKDCVRSGAVDHGVIDAIVAHVRSTGVKSIYFSNDIDGVDAHWADATGTPEPNGLMPEFVSELLRRLADDFAILAADVMEVAPPLEHAPGGRARTLAMAATFVRQSVDAVAPKG